MNHLDNKQLSSSGAGPKLAALGLLMAALAPLSAQAIDVDAADFVPAPAGTTAGLLYLQHAERDRFYAQGRETLRDPRLVSNVGIARLIHYTDVGGLTVAPQILVPFGRLAASRDTSALGDTRGVGDVIVTAPTWLVNDPQSRTYFALAPYLYLPVGSYDKNRSLNMGENRWKFNLQAGLVKGFTDNWFIDITADAMFHGRNDDYGASGATLKQDPLYQGQAYLRYQFTPTANAFVGLSQNWGGKTRVNGVTNDDAAEQRKFSVGGSYFVTPKTQLLVAAGRDIKVENGFKEDARINFRVMQVF
ncbi:MULTISPECIES: transporter [unclassified Brenneria]|uniref:transporter n=1 Tax=unclassified Brenneria TaxID=2634434 RepID=UPI0018F0DB3E|nr:transporter [Brenneria sp. L3-3C-1]MBJ7220807.1 transporter [Brenneria sp. L3-3C-1]MEE3642047.1 transporter [Brenneria sp. L3_3C_1]